MVASPVRQRRCQVFGFFLWFFIYFFFFGWLCVSEMTRCLFFDDSARKIEEMERPNASTWRTQRWWSAEWTTQNKKTKEKNRNKINKSCQLWKPSWRGLLVYVYEYGLVLSLSLLSIHRYWFVIGLDLHRCDVAHQNLNKKKKKTTSFISFSSSGFPLTGIFTLYWPSLFFFFIYFFFVVSLKK